MRKGVGLAFALGLLLATTPSAHASFHLMKVSEVYPGSAAKSFDDAFIELQMYAAGQNQIANKPLQIYPAGGGAPFSTNTLSPAGSGENQRTILIGDSEVPNRDFQQDGLSTFLATAGGAVCFVDDVNPDSRIDCVSWGSFTNSAGLPVGQPAPAPGPTGGRSVTRSIAPNCPTLLEAGDDTNDSATDFRLAAPSPRSNSTPPTERPCPPGGGDPDGTPDTEITKAPKNKLRKRKAKYKFTSTEPGSSFECAFDKQIKKDRFKPCRPPKKYKRLDDGRHKFQVAAIDPSGNVDPTPARDKFKVVD